MKFTFDVFFFSVIFISFTILDNLHKFMIRTLVIRLLLCSRHHLINLLSILVILILILSKYCLFNHFSISIIFVQISFLVICSIYIVSFSQVSTLLLCFLDSLFTIVIFSPYFKTFYILLNHILKF